MISQKIDDITYNVNGYEVINLYHLGFVCECMDWIMNKDCGKLGDCKHILNVKEEIK